MVKKAALITGITGQNRSYLSKLFLDKGYEVGGIKRCASSFNTERVDHVYRDMHEDNVSFKLHCGDLSDTTNLARLVQQIQPDEIYHRGTMSHVGGIL